MVERRKSVRQAAVSSLSARTGERGPRPDYSRYLRIPKAVTAQQDANSFCRVFPH
jgi:hypothetical protein